MDISTNEFNDSPKTTEIPPPNSDRFALIKENIVLTQEVFDKKINEILKNNTEHIIDQISDAIKFSIQKIIVFLGNKQTKAEIISVTNTNGEIINRILSKETIIAITALYPHLTTLIMTYYRDGILLISDMEEFDRKFNIFYQILKFKGVNTGLADDIKMEIESKNNKDLFAHVSELMGLS